MQAFLSNGTSEQLAKSVPSEDDHDHRVDCFSTNITYTLFPLFSNYFQSRLSEFKRKIAVPWLTQQEELTGNETYTLLLLNPPTYALLMKRFKAITRLSADKFFCR